MSTSNIVRSRGNTVPTPTISKRLVEISVKGKWLQVPSLKVNENDCVVNGQWLKVAIVKDEEWLETEIEDPALFVTALKNELIGGRRADIFTFSQKLPETNPKYKYPLEWDSVAAIRVNSFDEWWKSLPQESRKNVRRSQKRGVVVHVKQLDQNLLSDIVELNNDSPLRQGKSFTHYGKDLSQVTKDQADFLDRSDYICAYHREELIGLVKLVYRGGIASILTFLPKASHHDKRPANALMAKVIELCELKGMSHLTFGLFNYGNKRNTPLRDFKTRNGFDEILVPRYFVPLTLKGDIGLRLNLHRGLVGILPHYFITPLLSFRARLHQFKMSRCSSMLEPPKSNRQMGRSNPPAGSNP
jgi:hypothetical protein